MSKRTRAAVVGGGIVAVSCGLFAAGASVALADPSAGANSTPGTLTCPAAGLYGASTSGSPAARAIQLVDTHQVFVFKGSPDWGFYQGGGSSPSWLTCTLREPGPGGVGTIIVVGLLTPKEH